MPNDHTPGAESAEPTTCDHCAPWQRCGVCILTDLARLSVPPGVPS